MSFVKDFEANLEPRDQIEWLAEEHYWDALKDCPKCGEPGGLVYCPVCHGRKKK